MPTSCECLSFSTHHLRQTKSRIQIANRLLTFPPTLLRTHVQEGEVVSGISHLSSYYGKSYSGLIRFTHEIKVKAIHGNGRHPSLEDEAENIV
jgi:hypothetical protein